MKPTAQLPLDDCLVHLRAQFPEADDSAWRPFETRLQAHFERLFDLLSRFYGERDDFPEHLKRILESAFSAWLARPEDLKRLDAQREAEPFWYLSEDSLGASFYVDLFARDLEGVRAKIPYFKELGLTYIHLMPVFERPAENSDGGYAVSSYREIHAPLGTMDTLRRLAHELRENGISLVLDFVFNHTADEHTWARRALAGDPAYQDYYFVFPDRTMPDAYDEHLPEIFPEVRHGNFTYRPEIESWVWTTFHNFQWDLNYRNPVVLRRMAEEMFFLANAGAEILRLDALAFTWKALGTNSQNLPEAHQLIQIFNLLARIATPALLFKSEAIVHPDEVAKYISLNECQLSYNPMMMATLWEALAAGHAKLLTRALQKRFDIPEGTAWVNYVRGHDDIGWGFADQDAAEVGIEGYEHRQFLNKFYTGRVEDSFARGLLFQFNPQTKDARISGTCASLAGLERALDGGSEEDVEFAIRRILLVHSVILSIGGIPLLFLGDEIGTLNDYGYREDPSKEEDSRWVHRPSADWDKYAHRNDPDTVEGKIYGRLRRLIEVRKANPAFGGQETDILSTSNEHVLGYVRRREGQSVLALANFSDVVQRVSAEALQPLKGGESGLELVTGEAYSLGEDITLEPYRFVWISIP